MARTRGFDDGGFAPLTPRAPGMMIERTATVSPKKIFGDDALDFARFGIGRLVLGVV